VLPAGAPLLVPLDQPPPPLPDPDAPPLLPPAAPPPLLADQPAPPSSVAPVVCCWPPLAVL